MAISKYAFPVYGTQGGGLVRYEDDGSYSFVEVPDWMTGTKIGDPMPAEWSVAPANAAAVRQSCQEDLGLLDRGELMLDLLQFGPIALELAREGVNPNNFR